MKYQLFILNKVKFELEFKNMRTFLIYIFVLLFENFIPWLGNLFPKKN